jgi:hypothetical protein
MNHLQFDADGLLRQLTQLTPRLRAAFAAACAERLLPAYVQFGERTGRGDAVELAALLQRLWRDLEGEPMNPDEIQYGIDRSLDLMRYPANPDADPIAQPRDFHAILAAARARAKEAVAAMTGQAEDAAAALAYAFECRQKGGVQEAVWAARRADEALDSFVTNRDNVDIGLLEGRARVSADPLVQAELSRQHRDIGELLGVPDEADPREVIVRVRDRARADAATVFG